MSVHAVQETYKEKKKVINAAIARDRKKRHSSRDAEMFVADKKYFDQDFFAPSQEYPTSESNSYNKTT